MSVAEHRARPRIIVSCFVLTISDTRTLATETSGRTIAELLVAHGHTLAGRDLVRDEPAEIERAVSAALDAGAADAIITTGGTGIARRDSTCEAITALLEKRLDGFGELFRQLSYQEVGSAAMLSRAAAGIARGRAIFMLPGSEAAVRLAMEKLILPELGHIVSELRK